MIVNADDRRLIAESLQGRSSAFGELVVRYQDRLYNAVLRVITDRDDALDVVQDSFVNAYQSLASFKGDSEFYTWLYRIAFNAAISVKRRKRSVLRFDQLGPDRPGARYEPADASADARPGASLERTEDELAVHDALTRLSSEHRTVLVLKDIDGMKYDEIAEIVGVPVGTVRSRLHRARLELRDFLAATMDAGPECPVTDLHDKTLSPRPARPGE